MLRRRLSAEEAADAIQAFVQTLSPWVSYRLPKKAESVVVRVPERRVYARIARRPLSNQPCFGPLITLSILHSYYIISRILWQVWARDTAHGDYRGAVPWLSDAVHRPQVLRLELPGRVLSRPHGLSAT